MFVETGRNLTIRNCILRDSGNGLFVASTPGTSAHRGCSIYDNGIENSIYQHNTYTAAIGIVYQFNHFGPLRANCLGNNLKDRSAGLVHPVQLDRKRQPPARPGGCRRQHGPGQ